MVSVHMNPTFWYVLLTKAIIKDMFRFTRTNWESLGPLSSHYGTPKWPAMLLYERKSPKNFLKPSRLHRGGECWACNLQCLNKGTVSVICSMCKITTYASIYIIKQIYIYIYIFIYYLNMYLNMYACMHVRGHIMCEQCISSQTTWSLYSINSPLHPYILSLYSLFYHHPDPFREAPLIGRLIGSAVQSPASAQLPWRTVRHDGNATHPQPDAPRLGGLTF